MKKSVGACLKLMLHFLRNDEFKRTEKRESYLSSYEIELKSERVIVLCSGRTNHMDKSSSNYSSIKYNDIKVSFKHDGIVYLETFKFPNLYREIIVPVNIEDKGEFFSHMMENDIDYLKFEDLSTVSKIISDLKEIHFNYLVKI